MGQDYAQRKNAKKQWKKLGAMRAESMLKDEKAQRRERKKRKGRRLCQGMCYKDPTLTEEDKKWNGKIEEGSDDEQVPSDIEEEVVAERQRSNAAASASTQDGAAAVPDSRGQKDSKQKKAKKETGKKRKAGGSEDGEDGEEEAPAAKQAAGVRLSTGVQLLDPSLALQHANAKARQQALAKAQAEGLTVVEAEALKPYPPLMQSFMVSQGFLEPTPIQAAAWPACCAGNDFQGVAEPGSGKTLAYLLPGIAKLQALGHSGASTPEGPAMVVLTPTRELALQVAMACRGVRKLAGLRTACVYGGVPKEQQIELLQKHPHILVGTPGRILDLVDDGALILRPPSYAQPESSGADAGASRHLAGVAYVVLDEADKMLGLGFQPQLDRLRALLLPAATATGSKAGAAGGKGKKGAKAAAGDGQGSQGPRPQVALLTATMPPEVAAAAAVWLSPNVTSVTISHSAASISRTITQVVQVCAEHKKPAKLLKHLASIKAKAESAKMRNFPRVLVFANHIKTVRFLHDTLKGEGLKVAMLHGERSQPEREEAMREFKAGKAQVLVATDVAARGLDIRLLPYVVNYDFPSSLETYIHRVGRTGRLAAYGHAYSFFTRNLARIAGPLVELLGSHGQSVDPLLLQLADAWKVAAAHLGPEALAKAAAAAAAEEGGEGGADDDLIDARMEAHDLMEGMGRGAQQDGGKAAAKAAARAATAAATKAVLAAVGVKGGKSGKKSKREDGGDEGEAGNGSAAAGAKKVRTAEEAAPPSFAQRLQGQKDAGVLAGQAQAAAAALAGPSFVAAKRFAGARPGYVFKKGPQGLGYYVDSPPKVVKQRAAGQMQAAKGKGPIIAQPPRKSIWDSSSDEEDEGKAAGAKARSKAPVPIGGFKNVPKGTGEGGAGGDGKRGKPLPGRLRKKLAKEKAAQSAAGGNQD